MTQTHNSAVTMPKAVLDMTDIVKSFPGVKALQGVSFSVKKGEVHGLVGENGAGKSTLIRILSGAHLADSGELKLHGEVISSPSPSLMISKGVAVIYQEFSQAPHLTVAENIFLNRMPRKRGGRIDWEKAYRDSGDAISHLGFSIDPRQKVGDLSVAHRQIVEIARAITRDAQLIVLDEPSAVLGDSELETLFSTIRRLQKTGVSFIYISHRLKEVFELCQTVTVLRDGRHVASRPIEDWTTEKLIQSMVGRPLGDYFPARHAKPGEILLQVSDVKHGEALKGVSLTLRRGEIVGLCGLAGAGRTELLRAIYGADHIDSGSIEVNGKKHSMTSPRHGIALGMGFAPEDRKTEGLFLTQSIKFNITLSRLSNFLRSGILSLRSEAEAVSGLVKKLTVKTPGIDVAIGKLSGGNQQKCVIAKQLNAKCTILLIDEPTRGVDVGARREIYELLVSLVEKNDLGILMVSSELPEIIGMCDRILVMREGLITAELPRGASEEDIMKHATFH